MTTVFVEQPLASPWSAKIKIFTHQVDGLEYVATVEEKEQAHQKYEDARMVQSWQQSLVHFSARLREELAS